MRAILRSERGSVARSTPLYGGCRRRQTAMLPLFLFRDSTARLDRRMAQCEALGQPRAKTPCRFMGVSSLTRGRAAQVAVRSPFGRLQGPSFGQRKTPRESGAQTSGSLSVQRIKHHGW